ncbi:MAG TPA: tetratricopeptide repeat protein [Terriglobales bacterium]|nr:tetratricopeptide repeat protein [Terriglobales bacterium]
MRAETRHQLKEDRFSKATFHAAEQTVDWTVEHRSKLIIAGIVVAIAALIGFGGWYYMNLQDEKASLELGAAGRTLEQPVRPAGVPAQPGYPSSASSQERATDARKQFQAIVDKYPHTRTADMARYFVGLTSSQLGDNAAAERNLQDAANASNKDVAALAKLALASVFQSENKDSQAIDYYKQLIDKPTISVNKVAAQLALASFYEGRQKPDEAKRIYDQIQKENPATEAAQLAQQRAGKLK